VRTGGLEFEPKFQTGDTIVLTTDASHNGKFKVPVNYPALHEDLRPGDIVLADDGTLRFVVVEIEGRDMHCRAETAGQLKSRKGINVPFVKLRTPLVTERDKAMMEFAADVDVDFVGISFVESGDHVQAIRALTRDGRLLICSKIENQGGVDHMDDIVAASDAIMIDRGDLSVETSLETMLLSQKRIIAAARRAAKPVIVATEMLHTMIENAVPTKAEVSDISNAVLDGCSATMLSGETAVGSFPVEAVRTMRRIADVVSADTGHRHEARRPAGSVQEAMGEAIALMCSSLPITKIVAVTHKGYAARTIAARRPTQPILAVSDDLYAARSFNLLPGVEGIHVDIPFTRTSVDHIVGCLELLWQRSKIEATDMVLVVAATYPRSGARMNFLQTHMVSDLIEMLGWKREGLS
jgi:pyruvate kinase